MESPKQMCYDLRSALCNALGYLDLCLEENLPRDRLREVLTKAAQQAKRALDTEERLFKALVVVDGNPLRKGKFHDSSEVYP